VARGPCTGPQGMRGSPRVRRTPPLTTSHSQPCRQCKEERPGHPWGRCQAKAWRTGGTPWGWGLFLRCVLLCWPSGGQLAGPRPEPSPATGPETGVRGRGRGKGRGSCRGRGRAISGRGYQGRTRSQAKQKQAGGCEEGRGLWGEAGGRGEEERGKKARVEGGAGGAGGGAGRKRRAETGTSTEERWGGWGASTPQEEG